MPDGSTATSTPNVLSRRFRRRNAAGLSTVVIHGAVAVKKRGTRFVAARKWREVETAERLLFFVYFRGGREP